MSFARTSILILALAVLTGASALAQPAITWIDDVKITDMSEDGHVVTGFVAANLDVFRWTAAQGLVNLGGTTAHLGIGAGEPRVSADGRCISATIPAADSLSITAGLWVQDQGWQGVPLPAEGISVDNNLGASWGLSGDGSTVVGLFWLPPARAHAFSWDASSGPVDLGSQGGDSRANAASRNGRVIAGWSADPDNGSWQPTVWDDGVMTVLDSTEASAQCDDVSPDGTIIAGMSGNPDTGQSEATLFFRDAGEPTGWAAVRLGVLPGTSPTSGRSQALRTNVDGTVVVGLNYYTSFSIDFFVWTPTYGMMLAKDYFALLGVPLPSTFRLQNVTALSDDGRYLAGYGYDLYTPSTTQSFVIDRGGVAPVQGVQAPAGFRLEPNVPNPFNPTTTIALVLDRPGTAVVAVHDARGRRVRTLQDGYLAAGRHLLTWDGRDAAGRPAASGIYFAVARDGEGGVQMRRMMLVK